MVGKPPQVYLQVLNEALGQAMSLDDFIAHWFALRDEIFADEGAPFMPGADALIAALHARGVPLALVTGDFRRNVGRDFARSSRPELFACFTHVITYDPAHLLVVEDSPPGVEAATTAGCLTLILPGYGMISPDLAARAWRTIRHHDEVLRLFDEYGSR